MAVGHDQAEGCPRDRVFIALDHAWFSSAARAWTPGNRVQLFTEPAALWAATSAAIRGARTSVFWSTWWWKSGTDLLRAPGDGDRTADTALGHLEARPDLTRRVLVNMFLGGAVEGAVNLTVDAPLRAHGRTLDDGFEVLAQTNEEQVPVQGDYLGEAPPVDLVARLRDQPAWAGVAFEEGPLRQALEPTFEAASYHMKGTIIDGAVAFVQGENTQDDYWDTAEHAVFEPRRMPVDADAAAREAVAQRSMLPEFRPFQDYALRIEGPAVGAVEDVYASLWNLARARLSPFHENTSAFEPGAPPAPTGTVAVQIQATVPPPLAEQSILDGHRRALAQARRYILIEDQYWRATRLLDDFVAALERSPELVLIVVTNELAYTDGGKQWTMVMDEALRAVAPDRYLLLQRRAFDVQTAAEAADGEAALHDQPVYNHAKLALIDDTWLSVGSANKNNRSLLYDGEINAVVVDAEAATAARRRILADWLGPVRADALGDDMRANLGLLQRTAEENAALVQGWKDRWPGLRDADIEADRALRPVGTLFPYRPEGDFLIDVGPDIY
ncbi:MAG: phospholipase D family protein [bacterium]